MQENKGTIGQNHWYEHVPKSVETSKRCKVAILWNQQIQTDRIIPNSKPNIITVIMKMAMYVNRTCNLRRQKCD